MKFLILTILISQLWAKGTHLRAFEGCRITHDDFIEMLQVMIHPSLTPYIPQCPRDFGSMYYDQEKVTFFTPLDSSYVPTEQRVKELELKFAKKTKCKKLDFCYNANRILINPFEKFKVALDPGHIGGRWASWENRHTCVEGSDTFVNEGDLTLYTAMKLKMMLEEVGMEVMLTRTKIGQGIIEDFDVWKKQSGQIIKESFGKESSDLLSDSELKNLFLRHYIAEDLKARADAINDFRPNLTLVIHYNASTQGRAKENGKFNSSSLNYNMAFYPGAYMGSDQFNDAEIRNQADRDDFLRQVSNPYLLKKSMDFCKTVLQQLETETGVPSLSPEDQEFKTHYQKRTVVTRDESGEVIDGVYARNLGLNRMIESPMCYAEALLQDNGVEAANFAETPIIIGGENLQGPTRADQVAQAYFESILKMAQDLNCRKDKMKMKNKIQTNK